MRQRTKLQFVVFLSFLLLVTSLVRSDDLGARVDRLFSRWDRDDSPGCALAVVEDGQIVYKKGYGMANLELGVPVSPASVFYIGSVSKQFVAMCIALLADREVISLDDDIRKYVPEMPDYGVPVTIRHLIHHTGGIRDYLELEAIARIPFGFYHEQDVIGLISRQRELNFVPGEEHTYSNSGYFMLGVIVERASGQSLREFAHENIFEPLGMKNSRFHDDFQELIPDRAAGYFDAGKGSFRNFISTFDCVGSGGLFTSVEDLFLWDQNFTHHKVGGKDVMALLHTQGVLNSGEKLEYAFGLQIDDYRGLKIVEHGGSLGGYRAELLRFPEQRFSVIILSNLSSVVPNRLARQVADLYLVEDFREEKPKPKRRAVEKPATFHISEKTLLEFPGQFHSEEIQTDFQILIEDGKLCLRRDLGPNLPMQAAGEDLFKVQGWTIRFVRDAENQVSGFRLSSGRVRNLLFEKQNNAVFY
jgi:CubicO group peptidase (beta-lactamase class C family)